MSCDAAVQTWCSGGMGVVPWLPRQKRWAMHDVVSTMRAGGEDDAPPSCLMKTIILYFELLSDTRVLYLMCRIRKRRSMYDVVSIARARGENSNMIL